MTFLEMALIAFAVSIDGFWGGLAYGLKGVRIARLRLVITGCVSIPVTLAALLSAIALKRFIPVQAAQIVSGAALILIGVMSVVNSGKSKDERGAPTAICLREGVVFGLAVAVDASVATFAAGLAGAGFALPFIIGLCHVLTIGAGNWLGHTGARRVKLSLRYLPACILILLGITRLPIL